jgi:hypothetical protein
MWLYLGAIKYLQFEETAALPHKEGALCCQVFLSLDKYDKVRRR